MRDDIAAEPVNAVFEELGAAAIYTPPGGGAPVRCLVIKGGGDTIELMEGARFSAESELMNVRKCEVAAPVRGGSFQYLDAAGVPIGRTMTITAQPRAEDRLRLVWTCEVPK